MSQIFINELFESIVACNELVFLRLMLDTCQAQLETITNLTQVCIKMYIKFAIVAKT